MIRTAPIVLFFLSLFAVQLCPAQGMAEQAGDPIFFPPIVDQTPGAPGCRKIIDQISLSYAPGLTDSQRMADYDEQFGRAMELLGVDTVRLLLDEARSLCRNHWESL